MKENIEELEHELIEGCANDSEKHQKFFYQKYYGYVMAISLAYCKDPELASEVCDDSFLKFFSSISKYDRSQSIKSWLRRITINTAIDNYRKNKKYLYHMDMDETLISPTSHSIIDQLEVGDIYQLISELPETLRMVFNLYEIEGYSHKEIAKLLGIGESSSRTYLTRAKLKLRELVNKHFG
nr:RNA polymerase sigma factor [Allomuricauda sp.]